MELVVTAYAVELHEKAIAELDLAETTGDETLVLAVCNTPLGCPL